MKLRDTIVGSVRDSVKSKTFFCEFMELLYVVKRKAFYLFLVGDLSEY